MIIYIIVASQVPAMHTCSMCPFFATDQEGLVTHLVRRHRHATGFIVYCSATGCGRSFKNYWSFKSHIKRCHTSNVVDAELDSSNNDEISASVCFGHTSENAVAENFLNEAAYVLKLKTHYHLPHTVVTGILTETKTLFKEKMSHLKQSLLNESELKIQDSDKIHKLFDTTADLFPGFECEKKLDKIWQDNFGYVKPNCVTLWEDICNKRCKGSYRTVKVAHCGYYVPFLEQLSVLLSLPEVRDVLYHRVEQETNGDGDLRDVTDGSYLMQHEFVKSHPNALLFLLYTDDFEIVNPIGSHRKKHKVTAFYWTLLNIPVQHRSKLSAIQLLAMCKQQDLKKSSVDTLLHDFVTAMKNLWDGAVLNIPGMGTEKHFGMLAAVVADTPAAHLLGGFKEGVGGAEKPCRVCEIERNCLAGVHLEDEMILRDELEHRDRVSDLQTVSKKTFKYWSRKYGINGDSVLLKLPGFNITQCLLQDPMHLILEGSLKLELQCLLKKLTERDTSGTLLSTLNNRIDKFEYSCSEGRDKPQRIDVKHIEKGALFAQTAGEMITLACVLPYMMEGLVDSDNAYWLNFIKLLQITHLCLSPYANQSTVILLKALVASHNSSFVRLYPDQSLPPKMHYMVHLPRQIEEFGPLRAHWCMRFEAKNGFFKAKKWQNFKNVPLSLSLYHQRWMCLQMTDCDGSASHSYFKESDEIGPGVCLPLANVPLQSEILSLMDHADMIPRTVLLPNYFCVTGQKYTIGTVLLHRWDEYEEPQLVRIEALVVICSKKLLICNKLKLVAYEVLLGGFLTKPSSERCIIVANSLQYKFPQICHSYDGHLGVILQGVGDVFLM